MTLKAGDSHGGEGFSSDPLVMSDSMEAVGPGLATVLAGGMALLISVVE